MNSEDRASGFGWYLSVFVIGAATGAAIALLTAPRPGRETRELLKKGARDLQKRMEEAPGTVQRAAARAINAGQVAFEKAREDVIRS